MSSLKIGFSKNKMVLLVLVILSMLVLSLLFWLNPTNIPQKSDPLRTNTIPTDISNQPVVITTMSTFDTVRVEHFIQGLEASPDGHLKITTNTRQLLDVFLGDQANELSGNSIEIIKAQMHQRMKEPAVSEAMTLLEQYAAYKKAVADIELSKPEKTQQNVDNNLMAGVKIQQLSALRNKYLSPQIIQAFYANEVANTQYELARQRIMSIQGLSDEQRQEELNALQNQPQQNDSSPHL